MRAIVLALALAAAPAGAAQGQAAHAPGGRADPAALSRCLEGAKAGPAACIGRIAQPCLEDEANQTTYGQVLCADAERKVWEGRLAASSAALAKIMGPERLSYWSAAAAAWEGYRDAQCAFEASIYLGGSLAKVVRADCLMRQTALRAIDTAREVEAESENQ
jgi:uncharacterized protein YecT (DUF1311 family)